jgi:hypothetical protein
MSEISKSLLDQLEEATEVKPESENNKTFAWSGGEDKEENPLLNDIFTDINSNLGSTEKPKEQKSGSAKLSNEDKVKNQKASAETLTASIDIVFDLLGTMILNYKFKKNFTKDQLEQCKDLQDKDINELTGDDLALRNKFDRLNNKRQSKLAELPFDAPATARLNGIFLNYFAITGKEFSPEIMLYMGLGVAILEKADTIFTD